MKLFFLVLAFYGLFLYLFRNVKYFPLGMKTVGTTLNEHAWRLGQKWYGVGIMAIASLLFMMQEFNQGLSIMIPFLLMLITLQKFIENRLKSHFGN